MFGQQDNSEGSVVSRSGGRQCSGGSGQKGVHSDILKVHYGRCKKDNRQAQLQQGLTFVKEDTG